MRDPAKVFMADRQRLQSRLLSKCITNRSTGCWEWQAARHRQGYGLIKVGKESWLAHRISAFLFNGFALSRDVHLCHSCDNPRCINPKHLFEGNHKINAQDREQKGRGKHDLHWGNRSPHARLSVDQVQEIRRKRLAGVSSYRLAKEYGISANTAWMIAYGHSWRNIPFPESA